MDIAGTKMRPLGDARYATLVLLGIGLLVPGYLVQTLLLLALSEEFAAGLQPYGLVILSILPALVIAALVGWIADRWFSTSTALGIGITLTVCYSLVFYAIEQTVTF